jgi:aminocarboxymuconate-semialdehyde decarboxylase
MDAAGVDIAVVSLTCPQGNFGGEEVSARACRVSNDDMIAAQARWPDRVRFLAALPWQYPRRALEELEYACGHGAVGALVLGNIEGDSPVADQFAPIWEAIDERELPVLLHPTAPPGVEVAARSGMSNAVGFHFDTTHALERMINTGFLDRYRRLTIIGSHAGGFLPFIIGRLDLQRETERVPSSYLSRLYVDCLAFSQGALDLTLDVFSPANVLYGSDYPYGPSGLMERARARLEGLQADDRKRIEGGNAERIFKL